MHKYNYFGRFDPMRKPIGYWIKAVDRALDHLVDEAAATHGLSRRGWQVLTTVATSGPQSQAALDDAVRPFLDADEPSTAPQLAHLCERGWVAADGARFAVTDLGREEHDRVRETVMAARSRVAASLPGDDYATLVGLLERVATDLDAA